MSAPADDNNSTRGVELSELLRRHVRAELAEGVRSCIPAVVTRFDASQQQADCKPLIRDFHRDEDGALVAASVPVVPSVPVVFLTAGGFTFTAPIVANETTGLLLFADRSLDAWLAGQGQEVDPGFYTRSNLADAVFLPGLLPFGAAMSVAPPTDHATAGSVTGQRIHFHQGTICVGEETGAQSMFHAEDMLTDASQAINDLGAAVAVIGAIPPSVLSFVARAALPAGVSGSYLSDKAKNQ